MKTTMPMRSTANPRRTTLSEITDFGEGAATDFPAPDGALPHATANPQRTTLMEAPSSKVPAH